MAHIASDFTCVYCATAVLEPFFEPQMYMNSVFLIFQLVSLVSLVDFYLHEWVGKSPKLYYDRIISNNNHMAKVYFEEKNTTLSGRLTLASTARYNKQVRLQ